MKKIIFSLAACAALSQAEVFTINVDNTTQNTSFTQSFSSVTDTFDSLDTDYIINQINYTPTDAISAGVNFRGLPMNLAYTGSSTDLTLTIADIGVTETFSGATREDSVEALKDWLKTNGAATVEKIMKKLAEVSSSDPIAGNPNSVMSISVANDFSTGFMSVASQQQGVASTTQSANSIYIAPAFSSYDVDGVDSKNYLLPLAYSFNFDRDINEKITISMPISYTDVEGSKSASLGFGIAYTKPVTSDWILTPAISYGATGSADLGSLAQVASASLTSSYQWNLGDNYLLSMGNMVGYYSTVKFYDGDYAYDPGIENVVFRNALMINIPTNSWMNHTSLEAFVIDTRYTGTALYLEEYQEYGLSYGFDNISTLENYSARDTMKVGVSYLTSNKADGFKINFGFVF